MKITKRQLRRLIKEEIEKGSVTMQDIAKVDASVTKMLHALEGVLKKANTPPAEIKNIQDGIRSGIKEVTDPIWRSIMDPVNAELAGIEASDQAAAQKKYQSEREAATTPEAMEKAFAKSARGSVFGRK